MDSQPELLAATGGGWLAAVMKGEQTNRFRWQPQEEMDHGAVAGHGGLVDFLRSHRVVAACSRRRLSV